MENTRIRGYARKRNHLARTTYIKFEFLQVQTDFCCRFEGEIGFLKPGIEALDTVVGQIQVRNKTVKILKGDIKKFQNQISRDWD